jgi:peptidyl-prolyl cis-trans isomerase B (cyclophilin B)
MIVYKVVILLLVVVFGMSKISFAETMSPKVRLETSKGAIVLELDAKAAPKTVENFLGYVQDGFYDGTIFHRVIKQFMVQGGGFTADMEQKSTRDQIQNEADNGLKNKRGTIAMARTSDPHSATSQFFINIVDNAYLDFKAKNAQGWGYCVFGKVIEGLDVIDAIEAVKTTTKRPHQDVPVEPIIIEKAVVVEE